MVRHCKSCGCELAAGKDNHADWCPQSRKRDRHEETEADREQAAYDEHRYGGVTDAA
jgi:hypothetical protein